MKHDFSKPDQEIERFIELAWTDARHNAEAERAAVLTQCLAGFFNKRAKAKRMRVDERREPSLTLGAGRPLAHD